MNLKLIWGIVFIAFGLFLTTCCYINFVEASVIEHLLKSSPSNYSITMYNSLDESLAESYGWVVLWQRVICFAFGILGIVIAMLGIGWINDFSDYRQQIFSQSNFNN